VGGLLEEAEQSDHSCFLVGTQLPVPVRGITQRRGAALKLWRPYKLERNSPGVKCELMLPRRLVKAIQSNYDRNLSAVNDHRPQSRINSLDSNPSSPVFHLNQPTLLSPMGHEICTLVARLANEPHSSESLTVQEALNTTLERLPRRLP
jgi:hypothetical protein